MYAGPPAIRMGTACSIVSKSRGFRRRNGSWLRDKLKEKLLSWESNTFPDGEYIIRVTASDSPDNPPDQALTASIESERFTIDNTAPKITGLTGSKAGSKITVRWRAADRAQRDLESRILRKCR